MDESFTAFLPPVLYWKYSNGKNYDSRMLLGIGGGTDYYHNQKKRDYDAGIMLPPIFWGSSPDINDRYLFIWPFGGTIKGKIAQDEINAYIFPGAALFYFFPPASVWMTGLYCLASLVPVYASYSDNGFYSKSVFWPFFMKGSGAGRKSLRVFPFYARHSKENFYDRKMIMLLYNYGETYTSRRTYYSRFIFPFYGHKWTSDGVAESHTVLWPFFSWGYNRLTGEKTVNCPWPFFQKSRSDNPKMEKLIVFPFYGSYRYEHSSSLFVTPLYFRTTVDKGYYYSRNHVAFFIFWKFHREYRDKPHEYYGSRWDYYKIWPLFHYEKNDRGDVDFSLLSIFPFRDREGYERLYLPIFSLVEYHKHGDEKSFGLLMRTYYQYRYKNYFSWKIPLLASYSSYNGKITNMSFIFSAFGFFRGEEGSGFKVFWVSFVTNPEDRLDKKVANMNRNADYFENAPFSARSVRETSSSFASLSMEF